MITEKRKEEIVNSFYNESNDEDTQYWRYDLTSEELEFVGELDEQYSSAFSNLCGQILNLNK